MHTRERISICAHAATAHRRRLGKTGLAAGVAAVLAAGPVAASERGAAAEAAGGDGQGQLAQADETRTFDIPAQPLDEALERLAEATDLQFAYTTADVEGRTSSAVQGEFAPQAALRRLLRGTGLTHRFTDAGTVTLSTAEPSSAAGDGSAELGAIEVRAAGESAYRRDITTTGTRMPTSRKNVPQAINVVPKELFQDRQAETVNEALETTPGVSRGNGFGNTFDEFFIRGFNLDSVRKNGLEQVRDNGFSSLENVERVEVLKGPSSILFGQLEPGGVVNVVTEKPQRDFTHEIEAGGGTFGSYKVNADTTGPITQDGDLRYRLNASFKEGESFPQFFEQERTFIAPSVAWTAPTGTEVLFEMEYLEDERPFMRGQVAVGNKPADIPPERYLGAPWDQSENENQTYRLEITHPFGDGWRFRNATSYNRAEIFNLAARNAGLQDDNRTLDRLAFGQDNLKQNIVNQTELNGTFSTGPVDHEFVVGVDLTYFREEIDSRRGETDSIDIFDPVRDFDKPAFSDLTVVNDSVAVGEELGVFANNLMSYGPFKLMFGGRFDHTDFSPNDEAEDSPPDAEDDSFNPRVGAIYQPVDSQSFYASYTTSFVPFRFTQFTLQDGSLPEPTEGEQIEVGVKSDWLGGRLSTSVAAFNITKTNVANFEQDPDTGEFFVEQIGEVRSRGVELEAQGAVTENLQLSTAYTFIDGEVTEDPALEGNELVETPDHAGNIWANYTFDAGALNGLSLGAGVFARSDQPGDDENTFKLPAFARVDLKAAYEWRNLTLQANVRNLFDEDHFVSGRQRDRITPGEPLNAWFSLTARF